MGFSFGFPNFGQGRPAEGREPNPQGGRPVDLGNVIGAAIGGFLNPQSQNTNNNLAGAIQGINQAIGGSGISINNGEVEMFDASDNFTLKDEIQLSTESEMTKQLDMSDNSIAWDELVQTWASTNNPGHKSKRFVPDFESALESFANLTGFNVEVSGIIGDNTSSTNDGTNTPDDNTNISDDDTNTPDDGTNSPEARHLPVTVLGTFVSNGITFVVSMVNGRVIVSIAPEEGLYSVHDIRMQECSMHLHGLKSANFTG